MKLLIVILALIFSTNICSSQTLELQKPDGKIKIIQPLPFEKKFPQTKFLYNSTAGKVYALPLDNMPCLVTRPTDLRGVAKINLNGYKKIPNAIQEQKIIPSPELELLK